MSIDLYKFTEHLSMSPEGSECTPLRYTLAVLKSLRLTANVKCNAVRVTFPRFHRHLYKEEQDEIGGQHDHHDTTAIHGRI